MYSLKHGVTYVADAPGVTTSVIGSTVTEPKLLVAVTSMTSVVGPVGAGLEIGPVPPPGIHVGKLIVTTDWAIAVVGRSPSAKAPLRDFILRQRLKTRCLKTELSGNEGRRSDVKIRNKDKTKKSVNDSGNSVAIILFHWSL